MKRANEKHINVSNPFFSVIIPVYNVEKFLDECLDSVLRQTYCNYEVIMVDDGSSDSSRTICDKYAASNAHFFAYHKPNGGQLSARIYGMEKASGNYIVSLDSDDMLREDTLETVKNTIDSHAADLILFNASREKNFQSVWRQLDVPTNQILKKEDLYRIICTDTSLNNIVLKIFKREYIYEMNRIRDFLYIKNGEDLLQSLVVISCAERMVYINDTLYFYRINDSSMSNQFQDSFLKSTNVIGKMLSEYAEKWEKSEIWIPLAHKRNLDSYVYTIKYILLNCNKKAKRIEMIREIEEDNLFSISCEKGNEKNLNIADRFLISLVKKDKIIFLEFISYFARRTTNIRKLLKKV